MNEALIERLRAELASLREQGLYKSERVLAGPQGGLVRTGDREVINLCANNYLGLANHPALREAAHRGIDRFGYGMASVRFICGTQSVHKQLEEGLTPMAGCSRRCSMSATPSSPMRSTTPVSSTASACAKRNASATPTATWPSWKAACSRRAPPVPV
jgi:hypothetical protein